MSEAKSSPQPQAKPEPPSPQAQVPQPLAAESLRTQGETIAITMAALFVFLAGVYLARNIFAPAFFALTLVLTLRPLTAWMLSKKIPRPLATVTAIGLIYAFVLGLFAALSIAIAQLVDTLPTYSEQIESLWVQAVGLLNQFGVSQDDLLEQITGAFSADRIATLVQSLLTQASSFSTLMLLLFLTVAFLAFDMAQVEQRSASLARIRPGMHEALQGFAKSVRSYWAVSTIFGLIVAVLDSIALGILNVPMAITWGVVAFITNYIPNIGFVIGVIPPALLGLVDGGPWTALWVMVSYAVLNFVIQSVIQPKFTGDAVGLNTTTTFLSLMVWTLILGGLGAVLAVPMTLFVKALFVDSDPRSRWITVFLSAGDKRVPVPGAKGDAPVSA